MRYDAKGSLGGGTNVIKAAITTTVDNQDFESANYESASNVQTLEWQHIALTWRSGRQLTLYINGVLDQPTFSNTAIQGKVTGVQKLLIGRGAMDIEGGWEGLIDDVRIYDRVLGPTEIMNLVVNSDPIYGVVLAGLGDLTNQTQDASAGVTYYATVTNTGNTNDTITLTTSGDATATLSQTSVWLDPGASSVVTLTIPGDALALQGEYVVKVTATSEGDHTKTDEIVTTTTIYPQTKVFSNFPNPCNPETWIPYQLAKSSDVTVTIYSMTGNIVRTLALGHQPAGLYQSKSRAAYWDGTNKLGEAVASGVYFYRLEADDFTATRKMLILK